MQTGQYWLLTDSWFLKPSQPGGPGEVQEVDVVEGTWP